ncbi:hypothetical protein GQ600_2567 [Phytophthora cactorum]|nr:hypothetical protein GQ600_2567 [Phytophthora cactorum]
MFFANGFVETDRRASAVASEENDILRELLLDGEFVSPRQLPPTPAKFFGENFNPASTPGLQGAAANNFSLPNQSPLPASVVNAIVSPPRVFVQEFARLPQPFFHDNVSMDIDMRSSKPEKSTVSFLTSCLPPAPLPMLSMPPLKKKKLSTAIHRQATTGNNYAEVPGLPEPSPGKVCSISGCNKSALSRGKCPEHGGGSRCKKEGCSKFAQTRGLCKSHGGGRQCNVSGCTKNAHQNRLCRSHGGGKRCDYFGCPKWAQRSGYCCAHTKMSSTGASPPGDSQRSHPNIPAIVTSSSGCMLPAPVPSPTLLSPHRLFSLLP